jgi:hypothetical protein
MTIIDRPSVRSALSANSRAISAQRPRSTPVMASCHAGV